MARQADITLPGIERAALAIGPAAHETPLLTCRSLSDLLGCNLLLKAENLQRTGSFKVRGAVNRLATLTPEERRRGVIAASAGNHAQGVGMAARLAGVACTIVMPRHASLAKLEATRSYGVEVVLAGTTFDDAQRHATALAGERELVMVPAFDDAAVIAGQGTVGLEVCRQADGFDLVVVPVGGGGLIAGVATAVKALRPGARVLGVQTDASPAAARSISSGRRMGVRPGPALADGIAVGRPGALPFRVMRRLVDGMVLVSDAEVAWAIALLLERAKLLVEGAGAAGLAALLSGRVDVHGKTVVVVLSGGNIDPLLLGRVLDHGLARQGRFLRLAVQVPDSPGTLSHLLEAVARGEANVLEVTHHRFGADMPLGQVTVEVVAETANSEHAARLVRRLREEGYSPVVA